MSNFYKPKPHRKYAPPLHNYGVSARKTPNKKYLVNNSDMMTPGNVRETLNEYVLQDGLVKSDDRGLKRDMLKNTRTTDGPPTIVYKPPPPSPITNKKGDKYTPEIEKNDKRPGKNDDDEIIVNLKNPMFNKRIAMQDFNFHFDSMLLTNQTDITEGRYVFKLPEVRGDNQRSGIVTLRINSFYFPNINEVLPNVQQPAPDFFFYRKVFIRLVNIPTENAYIPTTGQRYHFEMNVLEETSQSVLLVPTRDKLSLSNPVDRIEDIEFEFLIPSLADTIPFTPIRCPRTFIRVQNSRFNASPTDDPTDQWGAVGDKLYLRITSGNVFRDIWRSGNDPLNTDPISGDGIAIAFRASSGENLPAQLVNELNETHFIDTSNIEQNNAGDYFITLPNFGSANTQMPQQEDPNNPPPATISAYFFLDIIILRNRIMPSINMITQEIDTQKTDYSIPIKQI